jgi:hypothetical protein
MKSSKDELDRSLERLLELPKEQQLGVLKQFFRGGVTSVSIRKTRRGQASKVASKPQNKVEEESDRRAPRQMDLFADGPFVHNRIEEKGQGSIISSAGKRNKRS